jgi:hypothetical protein
LLTVIQTAAVEAITAAEAVSMLSFTAAPAAPSPLAMCERVPWNADTWVSIESMRTARPKSATGWGG